MLSSDTLLIATSLDNLLSGNITSKDVVSSKKVIDKVEDIAKRVVKGSITPSKGRRYNFDKISEALEYDASMDEVVENGARLLANTEYDLADIIPKIQQIKELIRGLLPFRDQSDVLGLKISKPSKREQISFLRIYEAIDDPLRVLAMVADNSFTSVEMEIVKTVYPELVEGFSSMLMTHLAELSAQDKESLGHVKSLGIRRFFGEIITSIPAQAPEPQQAAAPKGGVSLKSFNAGNRMTPENEKEI